MTTEILTASWQRKKAYINNNPYTGYMYKNGAFERIKIYLYSLPKLKQYGNFYTSEGKQFYTTNGLAFQVVVGDYAISTSNAVVGLAFIGKAKVGEGS